MFTRCREGVALFGFIDMDLRVIGLEGCSLSLSNALNNKNNLLLQEPIVVFCGQCRYRYYGVKQPSMARPNLKLENHPGAIHAFYQNVFHAMPPIYLNLYCWVYIMIGRWHTNQWETDSNTISDRNQ